jgi:hypothetical protein
MTLSNKSRCIVCSPLQQINQMEHEMCSCLEWQPNAGPGGQGARTCGSALIPTQRTILCPPLHLDLSRTRSRAPTTSPPLLHPSVQVHHHLHHRPPLQYLKREVVVEIVGRLLRRHNGSPQLPTSHSNIPFLANSISPTTPPNYEGDSAKIVSSAGSNTMQIPGGTISPPYHHVHTRKSSSPIPAHTKTHSIDTKHTSPKKISSIHHHAPVKSNTVYAFARPCVW